MVTVALDIDLRKIYAVSDAGVILAKAEPSPDVVAAAVAAVACRPDDLVLIEVASPVMYIKDPKVVHNVIRWALWNITAALTVSCRQSARVLVAPSHVWTKGHDVKTRHEVAQCLQKQKDLRECEAMIFYHRADPRKWLPLHQYLENL